MSIVKVIVYLAAGLSILCGGIFILGSFGEKGQAWWIPFGLASIVIGWGLMWFTHRRAKSTRGENTPIAAPGNAPAQDEKPQKPKNTLSLLLMGLPVGALCGAISGCLLLYSIFKSTEPGWEEMPMLPEKAAAILAVRVETEAPHDIEVLWQSETGSLYSCSSAKTICSPSELTEKQAEDMAENPRTACGSRPRQQELSPHPPGNIIDSCQFGYTSEMLAKVILLEDYTLWMYLPRSNIDLPLLVAPIGGCVGGVLGALLGLGWVMWKRRPSTRESPPTEGAETSYKPAQGEKLHKERSKRPLFTILILGFVFLSTLSCCILATVRVVRTFSPKTRARWYQEASIQEMAKGCSKDHFRPALIAKDQELLIPGEEVQPFLIEMRAPLIFCTDEIKGRIQILEVDGESEKAG